MEDGRLRTANCGARRKSEVRGGGLPWLASPPFSISGWLTDYGLFPLVVEPIWHTLRGGGAAQPRFRAMPAIAAAGPPIKAHEDCLRQTQHTLTRRGNLRFPQAMPTEADTCRKVGVPKRPSPKLSFFGLEAREPNLVIALTGGDWAICRSCKRAESSRFVTSLRPCDAQSGYSLQWRLLGASAGGGWESRHHLETGSHLLTWLTGASAPVQR